MTYKNKIIMIIAMEVLSAYLYACLPALYYVCIEIYHLLLPPLLVPTHSYFPFLYAKLHFCSPFHFILLMLFFLSNSSPTALSFPPIFCQFPGYYPLPFHPLFPSHFTPITLPLPSHYPPSSSPHFILKPDKCFVVARASLSHILL